MKKTYLLAVALLLPAIMARSQNFDLIKQAPTEHLHSLRNIRTMVQKGALKMSGLSGTLEIYYAAPDRILTVIDLGVLKMAQGFDGQTAWMRDQNGQYLELAGSDRRKVINSLYLIGELYLRPEVESGTTAFAGDTLIDGQSFRIYAAVPSEGDSLKLFFNTQTARVEITVEYADELAIVTRLSDFRDTEFGEYPFHYQVTGTIPQLNSEIILSSAEANVALNDSLFMMPAVNRKDYFFPAEMDSVIVPVVYRRGMLFAEVRVAGKATVYFLLDTGTGANAISKEIAIELNLPHAGEIPAKGVAGYDAVAFAELDSLTIGAVTLLKQSPAVIDFSKMRFPAPGRLGGLLGYDFFSRFPLKVDYRARQMIIYNPERYLPPDSIPGIPVEFIMKIPTVQAEINGRKGKFLLDLGNALGLILHQTWVEKNNLMTEFTDIKEMAGAMGGIGGKARPLVAMADSFRVGHATIKKPRVLIASGDAGVLKSSELDGNIGNPVLEEFELILDYSRNRIYLVRRGE